MGIRDAIRDRGDVRSKEKKLEELEVEEQIESKRANISQLKVVQRECKKKYGQGWRKYLRLGSGSKLEDFYAVDPSLRELFTTRHR